jgi:hypothetical protein
VHAIACLLHRNAAVNGVCLAGGMAGQAISASLLIRHLEVSIVYAVEALPAQGFDRLSPNGTQAQPERDL